MVPPFPKWYLLTHSKTYYFLPSHFNPISQILTTPASFSLFTSLQSSPRSKIHYKEKKTLALINLHGRFSSVVDIRPLISSETLNTTEGPVSEMGSVIIYSPFKVRCLQVIVF